MKFYEVRDPIYGFIKFNEWEREIINHPVFQRLRRIRQLALTNMVYPGAIHTRFEHSLGVMHLASKMYDSIISRRRNREILETELGYDEAGFKRDRQIVRFAALLHDVGHGPFSHLSEDLFPLNLDNKRYKHEDYTVSIIKTIFKDKIESHKLNSNYNITADEVAKLIEGGDERASFWKILISSQLDADRADYLLRDSLHTGVKYGIYDLERLIVTLTLGFLANDDKDGIKNHNGNYSHGNEDQELVLGVERDGWHVAESLIIARYQMFTQVYYHKTRRAYDFLLKESLKESIENYPPPDSINEFIQFDDYFAWSSMQRKSSNWFERILERKHIRLLKETKEVPLSAEIQMMEKINRILDKKGIWYWEDTPEKPKEWYKMGEGEEIYVIDGEIASPLSQYSVITESLQKRFTKSRIYVLPEERDKAERAVKEV